MPWSGGGGFQPDNVTLQTSAGGLAEIKNGGVSQAKLADGLFPPIGVVMDWDKTFANTPALPSGWVECNGQVLSDAASPYNGQTIPNHNGGNRFFRGNATSTGTGGAATVTLTTTELPAHTHPIASRNDNNGAGTQNVVVESGLASNDTVTTNSTGSGAAFSILPPYYNMVKIMRVH